MNRWSMRPAAAVSVLVLWAACGGNVVVDSGQGAGGGSGGSTSTAICGEECTSDACCEPPDTCDVSAGFCVAPAGCTDDADCADDQTCVDGECVSGCTGTGGLPSGTGGLGTGGEPPGTGGSGGAGGASPTGCMSDADCLSCQTCDTTTNTCVLGCMGACPCTGLGSSCGSDCDCCSLSCVDGTCM
jgi:hypothetical protein